VHGNHQKPSFYPLLVLVLVLTWWIVAFFFLLRSTPDGPLIGRLLRPDYWWLVGMGTGVLILFLVSFFSRQRHSQPGRGVRFFVQMAIMVLPLLYLPTAVVSDLSPDAAKRRSFYGCQPFRAKNKPSQVVLPSQPVAEKTPTTMTDVKSKPPAEPSLLDIVWDAELFDGKTVSTVGMVYRDAKTPPNAFFCYRLVMFCCAADAAPTGVLVEYDHAKTLKKGSWVKIKGTVGFTHIRDAHLAKMMNIDDDTWPKIAARSVEKTEPPKERYLIP
jgi:uncharacterized repeat protein (TIGR03943 family)